MYIDLGKQLDRFKPLEVQATGVLTLNYADGTSQHVSTMAGLEALGVVVHEDDWTRPSGP